MGLDYYLSMMACLAVPIMFTVWWGRMRLGLDKRWFVMPSAPLISRNFYFALPTITLGLTSGLIGVVLVAIDPHSQIALYFMYVAFGLWGISFVFAYLEPDWMSPKWYRWLKREQGDILSELAVEAHQLGRQAWLDRVQTQADLESWVAEVRRKYRR